MSTSYVATLTDVGSAGDVTQLFPTSCTAGTGGTTAGVERRRPTGGWIYRIDCYTPAAAGGIIEVWDVAGQTEGVNNNVDTGTAMTAAYVAAEIAAGRGRRIWAQTIVGAAGGSKNLISVPIRVERGVAARFYTAGGPGADTAALNITVDGTFYKSPICGA